LALLVEFGYQEGDDFAGQVQAVVQHGCREQMTTPVIPASRLTGRTHSDAQEVIAVFAIPAAIALFDVGANRASAVN